MFAYIKAILFALLGGISAVLPLSATANVSFLNKIFGGTAGELHFYLGMVMFGAAAAILLLYYRQIYDILFSGSEKLRRKPEYGVQVPMFRFKDVIIGCAPLLLLFFPIGKGLFVFNISDLILDKHLALVEGIALIFSGVMYFAAITKSIRQKKYTKFNTFSAAATGVAQMLSAILPGTSRTGLTFSTAVMFRHRRNKSVAFSHILSFPALICGGFLHIIIGSASASAVPVFALVLTFVLSVFSSAFGVLVFSAAAGEKKSRFFSYINIALGLIAVISFVIRLLIK